VSKLRRIDEHLELADVNLRVYIAREACDSGAESLEWRGRIRHVERLLVGGCEREDLERIGRRGRKRIVCRDDFQIIPVRPDRNEVCDPRDRSRFNCTFPGSPSTLNFGEAVSQLRWQRGAPGIGGIT